MATPHAYFRKQFVPLAEAKIGIMTHAFNYGTAIRGDPRQLERRGKAALHFPPG